ncbi:GNAT family N-acetyltransferase [Conexibacter sp. JD483]|uniref:GNAT family N-acetyltransferase n=1 Tax=unclassified Conexibacter TaxID=2627773 RepID=UPI00271982F6|nr:MULTISPECIES: GNAT family N-acetyltransferase [unclassified Conexibacter]MDO8189019.1 GNAT family N-acetyltransferase [Conexibacter sp. CPCC 205706]MDO8201419.1 GNAT family N-acetyltransferase [Conexibacter sp. CPCC 205762]MDR9371694.1 GNAT family N-acetyltransferase [Conexibacter sp. JD483]
MTSPRQVITERLDLRPTAEADTDELYPIMSDPEGWWFDPINRHDEPERTRRFAARAEERWEEGLSYWTVRERASGRVVGVGGAQRHASGSWNLSYRIATDAWGRGYATELARAGIAAARAADPDVPVIAWVVAHNEPSRRVAQRLGLTDRGPHLDENDGQIRLAYADKPIDDWVATAGASRPSEAASPPAASQTQSLGLTDPETAPEATRN